MSGRAPTRAPLALPRTLMLAVALAAAAAPAHAKVTLQGTTTATAGWTDNVLDAPDEQVPNGPTRDADFFFQLAPGAVLTSISPRLLQRLAYTFTADLFVHHSEANSYSNSLEWAGDVRALQDAQPPADDAERCRAACRPSTSTRPRRARPSASCRRTPASTSSARP